MEERKEIKRKVLALVEKLDKLEEQEEEIKKLQEEEEKLKAQIEREYMQIKKLQEKIKKRNKRLHEIREKRKEKEKELKEIEKILKALGLGKKTTKKESKKQIQKYILINRKNKSEKYTFRSKREFIKKLNEKLRLSISENANIDGIVTVIKSKRPYALIKESKTTLRVFADF